MCDTGLLHLKAEKQADQWYLEHTPTGGSTSIIATLKMVVVSCGEYADLTQGAYYQHEIHTEPVAGQNRGVAWLQLNHQTTDVVTSTAPTYNSIPFPLDYSMTRKTTQVYYPRYTVQLDNLVGGSQLSYKILGDTGLVNSKVRFEGDPASDWGATVPESEKAIRAIDFFFTYEVPPG